MVATTSTPSDELRTARPVSVESIPAREETSVRTIPERAKNSKNNNPFRSPDDGLPSPVPRAEILRRAGVETIDTPETSGRRLAVRSGVDVAAGSVDELVARIAAAVREVDRPAELPAVRESGPGLADYARTRVLPGVQGKNPAGERKEIERAIAAYCERVAVCESCRLPWQWQESEVCPQCRRRDARILNPGIATVSTESLACLVASFLADEKSPATAGKALRYIGRVLNHAHDNGILPRKIRKPPVPSAGSLIRILSSDERRRIFRACELATWPRHHQFAAGDFWRCWFLWSVTFGFRLSESFGLPFQSVAGRRMVPFGIHTAERCPLPEAAHLELDSPGGWLVYRPEKQKRFKSLPLFLPIPLACRQLLEKITPGGIDSPRRHFVFDAYQELKKSQPGDYRTIKISLYRQWYNIVQAAGIPIRDPAGKPHPMRPTPHDIRRTCETAYDTQFSVGIGGEVTGHAARGVSGKSYSNNLPRVVAAVLAFDLPELQKAEL